MLTIPQAAQILGVGRMTVWRYIRAGILPAEQVGKQFIINETDLTKLTRPKPGRPITKPSPNKRGRKPNKENQK